MNQRLLLRSRYPNAEKVAHAYTAPVAPAAGSIVCDIGIVVADFTPAGPKEDATVDSWPLMRRGYRYLTAR